MNIKWIKKATDVSTNYQSGSGGGGYLSPQQVMQFLRIAMEASVLLKDIRTESNIAPKFEVPRISLNTRVLRRGTQGTRLADADRVKVATGLMELSTVLFRGELPVSDETFEDQVERDALADTLAELIAQAVGRDVEEILIKADTARVPDGVTDPVAEDVFDTLDGFIKRAQTVFPVAQRIDAAGYGTPEAMFSAMVKALPSRYRQGDYSQYRLYVPTNTRDSYQDSLSGRGTGLGDQAVTNDIKSTLGYRGIPVRELPLMSGTHSVNGSNVDYGKFAILTHPQNMVAGFQRRVRIEKWRDPREGATSFVPTVRFDGDWADPDWGVLAYNVPF